MRHCNPVVNQNRNDPDLTLYSNTRTDKAREDKESDSGFQKEQGHSPSPGTASVGRSSGKTWLLHSNSHEGDLGSQLQEWAASKIQTW